jgi:hypothetical protein
MGGCASTQQACVALSKKNRIKRRRRRRLSKRRVSFLKLDNIVASSSSPVSKSSNKESTCFDSCSWNDSESAADFHSACFDAFSLNGSDIASPRGVNQMNQHQKPKVENSESTFSEVDKNAHALDLQSKDSPRKKNGAQQCQHGFVGEASDKSNAGDYTKTALNHSKPVSNACLPCLASTTSSVEKRRALSQRTSSSKKKLISKVSFKWSEEHTNSTLYSPKAIRTKPLAGSTVPFCKLDSKTPNCWKHVEPGTFKVRGKNYLRDKKKEFTPDYAAYTPFGVDVFLSQRKIDHIARYVELPAANSHEEFPSILVVNIQIPLYPATIFQHENDGEGMNVVLYFKLSENYLKDLPSHFQESIHKLINDEMERVKSFPVDTIVSFRERLKILGRVANAEDLHLGTAEKKLMNAYNEKPVLTRPQHEFFLGQNYFEIDVDIHRFSYIARKGFATFYDRIKLCILDFGLTIQGTKPEDLPENILCCVRLNEIDYTKYNPLIF